RRRPVLDFPLCQPRPLLIRKAARCAERGNDAWRRAANAERQWRHRGAQFHDRVPVRTETGGFAPPPFTTLGGPGTAGGGAAGRRAWARGVHCPAPGGIIGVPGFPGRGTFRFRRAPKTNAGLVRCDGGIVARAHTPLLTPRPAA